VLAGVAAVLVLAAVVAAVAARGDAAKKTPAPARASVQHDDDANLMRRLQRPKLVKR
jgi:hypothetical protein